jgi:hypothetical protein
VSICATLKEGDSYEAKLPAGVSPESDPNARLQGKLNSIGIRAWQNKIRSNLQSAKAVKYDKFSVRRNDDGTAVIVTKVGKWPGLMVMGPSQPESEAAGLPAPPSQPDPTAAEAPEQKSAAPYYRAAIQEAQSDLEECLRRKTALESRIVRLRQAIDGLAALCE